MPSKLSAMPAGLLNNLTLAEIADLFAEWLDTHAADKAKRVMSLIRDTRGGKTYQSGFGQRMRGTGTYAELLARRFEVAVGRLGFGQRFALDTGRFTPPPAAGDQLDLFS